MSVRTEIDRLNAIKDRIRTNLVAQGITVPADTMLEEMAAQILSVAGEDGYTPVRGVDYWTADDIAAMQAENEAYIAEELAKRGQLKPEFAESLEWLAANGDTTKLYVLPDGMIYAYKLAEVEVEGGPAYTNLLPSATDTDGTTIYGGDYDGDGDNDGYKTATRLSGSSGSEAISTENMCASGFIPAAVGDIVRIKGAYGIAQTACYLITYDSSNARIQNQGFLNTATSSDAAGTIVDWSTTGDWYTYADGILTIELTSANFGSGISFFRFSGHMDANTIVTVNEEIVEGGSTTVTEYAWVNTGLAFVPADYEDRIIAVEETTTNHTARIVALEKRVESGGVDETEAEALARIKKWDKAVYDCAPLTLISDDRAKPALPSSEKTVEAVYAKYRALMAKYPEYITETNLGLSSSSDTFAAVDMLRFDFKEPDGRVETGYVLNETKPKIIFMTGVHYEYAGIYGLYYALEEIAENPEFKDIRRNAHIIVIPCSNPHCLGGATAVEGWTMSHVNANGVAIHNNFGVEFGTTNASATLGAYNYGGTEPYSEPETQYIDKVMRENSDAIAFVSCHNFNYGITFASDFVWMSSATAHMCNLCFRLIDKLTTAWMDKYGDTYTTNFDAYRDAGTETYATGDYRIGRATFSTSAGTEQLNATKYGILGTNLEIGDRIRVVSGDTTYTSETMTRGAEVYANFMRTLLWNYDHNDKKDYAPNLPWSE